MTRRLIHQVKEDVAEKDKESEEMSPVHMTTTQDCGGETEVELSACSSTPQPLAPKPLSLLDLPPELRTRIYNLVVAVSDRNTRTSSIEAEKWEIPALVKTCRQICIEALPMFFDTNWLEYRPRVMDLDVLPRPVLPWVKIAGEKSFIVKSVRFMRGFSHGAATCSVQWEIDVDDEGQLRLAAGCSRFGVPKACRDRILNIVHAELTAMLRLSESGAIGRTELRSMQDLFDRMSLSRHFGNVPESADKQRKSYLGCHLPGASSDIDMDEVELPRKTRLRFEKPTPSVTSSTV